jgi:hypothetical protein
MAYVKPGTDAWLARRPYVRDEVRILAEQVQFAAEVFLSRHRKTGRMHIEVTRGRKTDYYVSLVDADEKSGGAVAFDLGWVDEDGEFHPGADIMRRAAEA